MSIEQEFEQKRQWLKLFEALAENEKFMEAISRVKPIPKIPNVTRFDMFQLNYLANEQAIDEARDAIKADPQMWSDGTTMWGKLGEQIADDIERMGAKLIELGFPDPRKDFSNWRIIALMVGADPDGMMDDTFEHAVAYHAKRERDAKQVEAPENQSVAPVVVPADPVAENGLDRSKREFIWFGVRYEWLTETMMNALQVLFKAYQQQQRKVLPDEMVNMIGNLPLGGFFKVFEVDRAGWGKVHPVREIVGGHAKSGWYLIAQNSSQT